MKTGPCLARLVLCAALIAGSPPAQADDVVLPFRIRSLTSLTTPLPPTPVLPFWSLLDLRQENLDQRAGSVWAAWVHHRSEAEALCEIDTFVTLLHELDGRFESGGLECQPQEDKLLLFGDDEALDETMALIARLERALTAPIQVEVTVIQHDGTLNPPSVLDAAQARGLFEGHRPSWSGRARTTHGQPVSMGSHRARPYAAAAHAEVAEKSSQIRTLQRDLFEGTALTVVPHRLVGTSNLAVTVQFAVGRLLGMGEHDARLEGIPLVDAPRLAIDAGSMSARIPNGGALVYSVASATADGGSLAIVVGVSATAPGKAHEDLDLLPASLLTQSRGAFPFQDEGRQLPAAATLCEDLDAEAMPAIDDGMLQDLIRNTVMPAAWDDIATLTYQDDRLIVHGDEDARGGARQVVLAFQNDWTRTSEVEFRAGSGDQQRLRISFPALHGRNHALVHGVESTALDGEQIEIAADSGVTLPQVVDLLHGLRAGVCVQLGEVPAARLQWRESLVGARPQRPRVLPPVEHAERSFMGTVDNGVVEPGSGLFGDERWSLRPVR